MSEPKSASEAVREPVPDRIEVRLLGPLRVRRVNGTLVDPREWRTGKTADLVRLLALHEGQAVAVDTLLEALWPHADAHRGRASLRTAASQVRRILGPDCLQRRFGGLELRDVWVDASTFMSLAAEARRLAHAGRAVAAVTAAREADALYLGDFQAHGDTEEWALQARTELAKAHLELICSAAGAAASLGWMRDAVEFAGRAVAVDRFNEPAYRFLMQGYAGLGQTSQALLEFERCRTVLAEELGVDPSPSTRALHLQLLTAAPAADVVPPFVGRRDALNRLKAIFESATGGTRTAVLTLVGAAGAGTTRLVHEACREAAAHLIVASCQPVDGVAVDCRTLLDAQLAAAADRPTGRPQREPVVVLLEAADEASDGSVQAMFDERHGASAALTVVLTGKPGSTFGEPAGRPSASGTRPLHVELAGLPADDVAELAGKLLSGEVSAELVQEVVRDSDGLPGRVVSTVLGWSRAGRIAATAGGLVLTRDGDPLATEPAAARIAPLLERLDAGDLAVLLLLAVLARPAEASVLAPLVDDMGGDIGGDAAGQRGSEAERARVQACLHRLVDHSVLVAHPAGYVFRDPLLRDALQSWLRPAARQDLHRRVAERGHIPTAERVQHWLRAGETQLGRSAAVAAAAEAMADARYEDARTHLMQICSIGPMPETVPGDRVDLFERLGDVCAVLERRHEARAAYSVALSVARTHGLPDQARIAAKRDKVSESEWLHETAVRAQPSPAPDGQPDAPGDGGPPDTDLEQRLRRSLEVADRLSDPGPRAEARLRLATTVCTPRRQFRLAGLWAQEAMSITVEPGLRARALLASWLPGILFGEAQLAEQPLEQAAELAERAGDVSLRRRVHVLQCLVAHDLGRPNFDRRWADASAACAGQPDANWTWVQIRVATERGDLRTAQTADRVPATPGGGPLARQMRAMSSATLRAELGEVATAVELLQSVVDTQRSEGWSLLLPEAFAWLIALRCPNSLAAAKADFDLLDRSVGGDHGFPREQCLRLLARSAIRATNRQYDAAVAAASNAHDVAAGNALPHLAAIALRSVSQHGAQAERRVPARAAVSRPRPLARAKAGLGMAALLVFGLASQLEALLSNVPVDAFT